MKYQYAEVYTKWGNLLPFVHGKHVSITEAVRRVYAEEREIQLLLLVRHDYDSGKIFCRIKCPVNPLPVKGEFEVPNLSAVRDFLILNGWSRKQIISTRMFE